MEHLDLDLSATIFRARPEVYCHPGGDWSAAVRQYSLISSLNHENQQASKN
jgi:hypothetical protein